MGETDLNHLREEIDHIDDQLLNLLTARVEKVSEVLKVKCNQGDKNPVIYYPKREAAILDRLVNQNKSELSDEAIRLIFSTMITQCRLLQCDALLTSTEKS